MYVQNSQGINENIILRKTRKNKRKDNEDEEQNVSFISRLGWRCSKITI